MADEYKNPMDELSPGQRRSQKSFKRPTDRLNRSTVQRAVQEDTTIAGNYKRKTITLPPEQIDLIDELRRQHGVGVLAMYRWLIDQGLQAYEEGARPEPDDDVVHDIKVSHWSSQVNG